MARQNYGTSPWGSYFMGILETRTDTERLKRGKSYANTGKVADFVLKGPKVSAKVAGHYQPWYKVSLEFPPFTAPERRAVLDLIAAEPALQAAMGANELPMDLIHSLETAGIELLPRNWASLERHCSCPDYGDPCKHMAALYYMMAREIDQNPHSIFLLRGLDLKAEFPALEESPIPPVLTLTKRTGAFDPPDREPDWNITDSFGPLILSLLRPGPAFYGAGDFHVLLAEFQHTCARRQEALFTRGQVFAGPWLSACTCTLKPGPPMEVHLRHPLGKDLQLPILDLIPALLACDESDCMRGSPGFRFLWYTSRLFWNLVHAQAIMPAVDLQGKTMGIRWKPLGGMRELDSLIKGLALHAPPLLDMPDGSGSADGMSTTQAVLLELCTSFVHRVGYRPGSGKAMDSVAGAFFAGETLDTRSNAHKSTPRAIAAWTAVLDIRPGSYRYRFELEGSADPDNRVYSLKAHVAVVQPVIKDGTALSSAPPPWTALHKAATLPDGAAVLGFAVMLSAWLPELGELQKKAAVPLGNDRLLLFLKDAAPALRHLGVEILLPRELSKALKPRLAVKAQTKKQGNLDKALNLADLYDYSWTVSLGDQTLSMEEFEELAKASRGLVRFKDGFVLVDPAEMQRMLDRSLSPPRLSDALAEWAEQGNAGNGSGGPDFDQIFRVPQVAVPQEILADLRHYQQEGYSRVWNNLQHGFGYLLADDMGLGKTLQAICVVQKAKNEGALTQGCLVIVPATLLVNWQRELARFAPALVVSLYHGPRRRLAEGSDLYLSTYETVLRDREKLVERRFSLMVLDEAHGLKNATTKRSLAIRSLRIDRTLALSGTPVENRLEDLRALFDLVVPGYLGTANEFRLKWRIPVELHRDTETAERLKKITAPFMMRRLKTDPAIAGELPQKTVIDEYAVLAPAQAALYQSVLDELARNPGSFSEGAPKQALLLKLLTALKQVCNHPRAYDGQSPCTAALSGKARLLLELLEDILEGGEKVLVFSQYVGTLDILKNLIEGELGESCLVLHGGMNQDQRSVAVDSFQNNPARRIFLISLKAGGVGLNLTAASRVIHYDLWFNPAVEQQASDRAFRIGQSRAVFVHRLICTGTFEEKIDAMIKSKQELAHMSVASGEHWLSDLSPGELRDLFSMT